MKGKQNFSKDLGYILRTKADYLYRNSIIGKKGMAFAVQEKKNENL